ncbi:MAG TPA: class I SAM-dependent methyltransferase [[Clostridium] spiroforme]|uniref:Class I SAM-dependent methyltransferase n=1 Tax=Thomasclavelia spiroformis TaxID=29348 RepID=A0A921KLW1_9FIRM|nr:class I SAM-dependent methyltransferase [Thomasclavelia spiroformis]
MSLEKELRRKRKNRNFAIKFTDANDLLLICDDETSSMNLRKSIEAHLATADMNSQMTVYRELHSNRKYIGKTIIFIKKAVRKLITIFGGWYIFPVLEQQTKYNAELIKTVGSLRKLVYQMQEEMQTLKEDINYLKNLLNINYDYREIKDGLKIDYFGFENQYRGPREMVLKNQEHFVDYYRNKRGIILDIGCGRGEFLEVMKSNGIPAVGVDMYEPFVKFNKEIGLDARLEDGITHLMNLADDSVGGVFMSHVVEHLNSDYILKLIPLAYQKMEKGAYFILQTPNPESLFTFIDFYIDIEHRKPVHFKTLEFFFKQAGFSEVKRFDPPETKFKEVVTYIDGENLKNVQAFNNGMGNLNQYLTGYQDYVLIAKK